MRALMQNPQFMQMMMNPQMINAMSAMQNANSAGVSPTAPGAMDPALLNTLLNPTPNQPTPPIPNPLLANPGLMQMLMGGANQGAPPAPVAPAGPPEEVFAVQLQQLRDMGFFGETSSVC